jgi:hypothetical protein
MKIQAGKLVVNEGKAACECCGGDPDELPPWVPDPDDPIWGGGPSGPVPPSGGSPRCCGGNAICSPVNSEPLLLRHFVAGEITAEYSYNSGPNAGQVFDYSAEWAEVFDDDPSTGCQASDSSDIELEVPYVSKNGNPNNPVLRPLNISISRLSWNQNRGFFGASADDPMFAPASGIRYSVDNIRGHVNSGYTVVFQFCRSILPALPITVAPDRVTWIRQPEQTNFMRDFELPATTPTKICLNQVVAEYTDSYTDTTTGGTTTITITMRLYAFVSGLTPCLTV